MEMKVQLGEEKELNEQWEKQYFERYEIFHKAIKDKYPEIKLITSAGWTAEGDEFDKAYEWMKTTEQKAELVDEHFYKAPKWFIENVNRYDNYDRNLPKVFAGEYAAHTSNEIPERRNNWEAALSEAAFLTGIEKNSDHVWMASYAPLFGKTGYCQWQPNLIWFNNSEVYGTPSYYVQQIFSTNVGNKIIPTEVKKNNLLDKASNNNVNDCSNQIVEDFYVVSNFNNRSKEIIIKVVNLSEDSKKSTIKIEGINRVSSKGTVTILKSESLMDENTYEDSRKVYHIKKVMEEVSTEFTYEFSKYSVTVIRLSM